MDLTEATERLAISTYEWQTGSLGGWGSANHRQRQNAVLFAKKQLEIVMQCPEVASKVAASASHPFPSIVKDVTTTACQIMGFEYDRFVAIGGRKRSLSMGLARCASVWVCRNVIHPRPSLVETGLGVYGKCNHTSVIHQIRRYRDSVNAQQLAREVCARLHLASEYDIAMRAEGLVPMAVA